MAETILSTISRRSGERKSPVDAVGTTVDDCLVLIVGTDGNILEHTSGPAELLHAGSRTLRNLSLGDIWPQDIAQRIRSDVRKCVRSRGSYRIELRNDHDDSPTHHEVLVLAQGRDRALMICRDLTESKNLERHVRDLAFSDPLTQLPNRAAFLQQLGEAISVARLRGSRLAVVRLSLGGIKFVNMTFGRVAGNDVVREVAERIGRVLDEADGGPFTTHDGKVRLARTQGNEYTLLLLSPPGSDEMVAMAERLIEAVAAPFSVDGNAVQLSANAGIAEFPQDAGDLDTLIANAGVALHEARGQGNDRCKLFSGTAKVRSLSRLDLAHELRWALENDQFSLSFQPCYDIQDNRIVSAEALLRWHHPLRGLVPLSEIMPVVEMNDLSEKLGEWVLTNACEAAKAYPELDYWKISLNLSSRQAFAPLLVDMVLGGVEALDVDPGRIQFEIRESDFFRDASTAEDTARRLRQRGFNVTLDDCGVGTLSVQSVVRAGVSTLKISRSLVSRIVESENSRRCCAAIVALARELGVRVAATGVETKAQYDCLRELGCRFVQGFYLSQPVKLEELAVLLTRQRELQDAQQ